MPPAPDCRTIGARGGTRRRVVRGELIGPSAACRARNGRLRLGVHRFEVYCRSSWHCCSAARLRHVSKSTAPATPASTTTLKNGLRVVVAEIIPRSFKRRYGIRLPDETPGKTGLPITCRFAAPGAVVAARRRGRTDGRADERRDPRLHPALLHDASGQLDGTRHRVRSHGVHPRCARGLGGRARRENNDRQRRQFRRSSSNFSRVLVAYGSAHRRAGRRTQRRRERHGCRIGKYREVRAE